MFKLKNIIIFLICILISSCLQNKSNPMVTNGEETDAYPAIVQYVARSSQGSMDCSGGIISDNTMITAAHCIARLPTQKNKKNSIYNRVALGNKTTINILTNSNSAYDGNNNNGINGARAVAAVYPSGFNLSNTNTYIQDIAIIVFADNIFSNIQPITVAESRPEPDTLVRLVGYGCKTITNRYCDKYGCDEIVECAVGNNGRPISTKRTGTTRVVDNSYEGSYCDSRMIQLNQKIAKDDARIFQDGYNYYMEDDQGNYIDVNQGEDVNSAPGDSGSPVLLYSNTNFGKFVGITSSGNYEFKNDKETCYTDPLFSDNVEFLKATLQSPINARIPWLE